MSQSHDQKHLIGRSSWEVWDKMVLRCTGWQSLKGGQTRGAIIRHTIIANKPRIFTPAKVRRLSRPESTQQIKAISSRLICSEPSKRRIRNISVTSPAVLNWQNTTLNCICSPPRLTLCISLAVAADFGSRPIGICLWRQTRRPRWLEMKYEAMRFH